MVHDLLLRPRESWPLPLEHPDQVAVGQFSDERSSWAAPTACRCGDGRLHVLWVPIVPDQFIALGRGQQDADEIPRRNVQSVLLVRTSRTPAAPRGYCGSAGRWEAGMAIGHVGDQVGEVLHLEVDRRGWIFKADGQIHLRCPPPRGAIPLGIEADFSKVRLASPGRLASETACAFRPMIQYVRQPPAGIQHPECLGQVPGNHVFAGGPDDQPATDVALAGLPADLDRLFRAVPSARDRLRLFDRVQIGAVAALPLHGTDGKTDSRSNSSCISTG